MKKVGALWTKTGKGDKEFFSGTVDLGVLGKTSVMIFPNDRKGKDNEPDYTICLPGDKENE